MRLIYSFLKNVFETNGTNYGGFKLGNTDTGYNVMLDRKINTEYWPTPSGRAT